MLKTVDKLYKVNFSIPKGQHEPVSTPNHPYWLTGDTKIVSYAHTIQDILSCWADAKSITFDEVDDYHFSDKFPCPQWFKGYSIKLWIPGRGVGKARPRFGKNGSIHTADNYGNWKTEAIAHLSTLSIPGTIPQPCKVKCQFVNFASSDSDNLTGSVLDALVQAEILANDSSSYVAASSGKFVKWRKRKGQEKKIGILVEISPAEIELLDEPEYKILGM